MQFREVGIEESAGCLLGSSIFLPSGRKLWGKGHRLAAPDMPQMKEQGIDRVWVVDLDTDEVHESQVARQVAESLVGPGTPIRDEPGGRASIKALVNAVLEVDEKALFQLNEQGFAVAATRVPWSVIPEGERAATVKSQPFAVKRAEFDRWLSERQGCPPALRLRPLPAAPRVSVIFCDPVNAGRASEHLADPVRQRLARFNPMLTTTAVVEEAGPLAAALEAQVRTAPAAILVASTHAPSGPEDAIGQAMQRAGAEITSFMAPVEPGTLALLGYRGSTPILAVPSCFRNPRVNVLDILLPPLLAGSRLKRADIARLGPGGLLEP